MAAQGYPNVAEREAAIEAMCDEKDKVLAIFKTALTNVSETALETGIEPSYYHKSPEEIIADKANPTTTIEQSDLLHNELLTRNIFHTHSAVNTKKLFNARDFNFTTQLFDLHHQGLDNGINIATLKLLFEGCFPTTEEVDFITGAGGGFLSDGITSKPDSVIKDGLTQLLTDKGITALEVKNPNGTVNQGRVGVKIDKKVWKYDI